MQITTRTSSLIFFISSSVFLALLYVSIDPPLGTTHQSGVILEHFDRNVRPQDDLYRYVNGAWLDETVLDEDALFIDVFSYFINQITFQIQALV